MKKLALVTACDQKYAGSALNLIGSVQSNSKIFDEIVVYNLGLDLPTRMNFRMIKGVKLKRVPMFVPYALKCWTWKPWIWSNVNAERVLYLDAGAEVMGSLQEAVENIDKYGYFVVSQHGHLAGGHTVNQVIPKDYYQQFDISKEFDSKEVVGSGVVGFRKDSEFYKQVIGESLRYAKDGYTLGWSKGELSRNKEIHKLDNPTIRNCQYFRHEQTLLNIFFYKFTKDPRVMPMNRYASLEANPNALICIQKHEHSLEYLDAINYKVPLSIRRIIGKLSALIVLVGKGDIGGILRKIKKTLVGH